MECASTEQRSERQGGSEGHVGAGGGGSIREELVWADEQSSNANEGARSELWDDKELDVVRIKSEKGIHQIINPTLL